MSVITLLRILSASHLRSELLKIGLACLGVALGVAVFTAIHLATTTAEESFERSAAALTVQSDMSVVGAGGALDEGLYPLLRRHEAVELVQPRLSRIVERIDGGRREAVLLIGLDLAAPIGEARSHHTDRDSALSLLSSPNAALVSPTLGIERGATIELLVAGRRFALVAEGVLHSSGLSAAFGGNVLVMDIAHVQDILRVFGVVDAFEIKLRPGFEANSVAKALETLLPVEALITTSEAENRQALQMTAAFRLNLRFLSAISLFVGMLLVYNTVSYLLLKRRRELGILRSLGATSRQLFALISLETLAVATLGSAAGVGIGVVLARGTTKAVARTVSNLYLPLESLAPRFSAPELLWCFGIGLTVAFLGNALPAREVFFLPARETFGYQTVEQRFRRSLPQRTAAAIACLFAAALFARPSLLSKSLYLGFVSPTFLVTAAVLGMPTFLSCFLKVSERVARGPWFIEIALAVDHLLSTLRRSATACAAMVVALGMFIGVSVMILSFRGTVADWIVHITTADLYFSPPHSLGTMGSKLSERAVQVIAGYHGAEEFDWVTSREVNYGGREVKVVGSRFAPLERYQRLLLKDGALSGLNPSRDVFVSEPFAERFGVRTGDELSLPGISKSVPVVVRGVYFDYSSDRGTILISDKLYGSLYGKDAKDGVSLYLKDHVTANDAGRDLSTLLAEEQIGMRDNQSLRAEVLRVFDDTFRITYILQAIALVISGFTLLNAILMLMLEREREFGVLRAIGASSASLMRMVAAESLLLGSAALIAGVALGMTLALLLVFVINKFFFAWSSRFTVPEDLLLGTAVLVLLISLLAGALPGRRIAGAIDAKVLRYE